MVFYEREESEFYAYCVEQLLFAEPDLAPPLSGVVELGAGTGEALARAVKRAAFRGTVHGFERDAESYRYARKAVDAEGVADRYVVQLGDFFDAVGHTDGRYAISNPPYLPGPAAERIAPSLFGGYRGNHVSKRVLSCGFPGVVLMVSSFSDPLDTLLHASRRGYRVRDWFAKPIPFGRYSGEPAVHRHIEGLAARGKAFVSDTSYLLAGVSWTRQPGVEDRSGSLAHVLTSLR